jgi:4-amino-4-deoxy-L-arabinose transferase-like glycosyltransferase
LRVAANPGPVPIVADAAAYEAMALSLLRGEGYAIDGRPTSYKPPAYPAFLALVYRVAGHRPRAAVAAQAIVGALTCVLAMAIGWRLSSPAVGVMAGVLAACSPALIRACGLLLTETLTACLLTAAVWLGLALWQDRKWWQAAAWGLSLGALALTRSVFVFLPLAWWLIGAMRARLEDPAGRRAVISRLTVGTLVCLSLLGAWSWRNWRVHRQAVLLSTEGGASLYASYRPPDGDRFGFNAQDDVAVRAEAIASEVERDRFYYAQAVSWIRTHLAELPRLTAVKLALAASPWDWELIGRDGRARYHWLYGMALPFILLGIAGVRAQRREGMYSEAGWLAVPLGYLLVMTVAFYGSPRFRMPFEPLLLVLAAMGIVRVVQRRPWSVMAGFLAADAAANVLLITAVERVRGL